MTDLDAPPPLEAFDPLRAARADDVGATAQPPLSDRETLGFYRAMQSEREKRQALEKELAALKASAESRQASDQRVEAALRATTLTVSRRLAEQAHGKDRIAAIHDWAAARCDADPAFNAAMHSSDDPYEAARAAFDEDPANAAPAPTNPLSALASPPRSLANAPGQGGAGKPHTPIGEGNAYAAIFN